MSEVATEGRRPNVAEFLDANGWTDAELAEKVGVAVKTVQSRKAEPGKPIPAVWLDRLAAGDPTLGMRQAPAESIGRDSESPPRAPRGARVEEPPPAPIEGLDFATLAGYIEGAYKLGAKAIEGSDVALSTAIDSHARQAGEAWARWVESEPKVAALIQRMMIGTPLGEVVAVHVGIGFAYFLSRSAIERAQREEQQQRAAEQQPASEQPFAPDGFVAEPAAA